jgi:hemerythrin
MGARLPRATFLTTAEAARELGVSVATLKRWAQSGLLPSERTEGGHRRFRAEDVQALAEPLVRPDDPVMLGANLLLLATDPLEIQAWLQQARRSLGSWWAVARPLRSVVAELLRRRESGVLGAIALEVGIDRLRRALLRISEAQLAQGGDRVALLASVPGDPYLVAPAVLQLCLPESGWRGEWTGHPRVEDLAEELRQRPAEAIIVSSSVAADPAVVEAFAGRLEALAAAQAVPTAVIGMGWWPSASGTLARLDSAAAVKDWVENLRPGAPAAARPARGAPSRDGSGWDPSLAIGHAVIDAQHETLFFHAARYLRMVERGDARQGGQELLVFLADYAQVHFRFEEELMRSSGFPGEAEHTREHERFAARLAELTRSVETDAGQESLERIGDLLESWLRDHVSGSDQRIGDHLRAVRPAGA